MYINLPDKVWGQELGYKNFVVVGEEEGLHPMLVWFVHLVTNYILYIGLWDVLPAPSCRHPRNSEITFSSGTCTCIYSESG